jgi:hypothetical protein
MECEREMWSQRISHGRGRLIVSRKKRIAIARKVDKRHSGYRPSKMPLADKVRKYPKSRKHAEETGCKWFEKRD